MKLVIFMNILAAILNIEGMAESEPTELFKNRNLRIVEGRAVDIIRVPFHVALEKYYIYNCGGSLISQFHVLTAGHCLRHIVDRNNVQENEIRVRAGISRGTEFNIMMLVQMVRLPDNFQYKPLRNDIGIIRLKEQATYSKFLQPIPLNREKWPQIGEHCTATGYGSQKGSKYTYQDHTLKMVHLEVFHRANCKWMFRDGICAGTVNGKEGICHGDSGSPLTINGFLAGIASAGLGCGMYKTPAAFTNVRYHIDWIDKCMSRIHGDLTC